jgi:hypothetical protein
MEKNQQHALFGFHAQQLARAPLVYSTNRPSLVQYRPKPRCHLQENIAHVSCSLELCRYRTFDGLLKQG